MKADPAEVNSNDDAIDNPSSQTDKNENEAAFENEATTNNVEEMSENEFMNQIWQNICGKPRPAKFNVKEESEAALNNG